jgi:hypothetical protein
VVDNIKKDNIGGGKGDSNQEINLPEDNRASISASIFLSIGDINNRHNKWEITPKTTTEEKE